MAIPPLFVLICDRFFFNLSQNITLTRLKDRGVCLLTPLPSELPKPSLLKTGLREVRARRNFHYFSTMGYSHVKRPVSLLWNPLRTSTARLSRKLIVVVSLNATTDNCGNWNNCGRRRGRVLFLTCKTLSARALGAKSWLERRNCWNTAF